MATIKEIKKYLETNIRKGYKKEDLVKYLAKTGVPKEDIAEAERELGEKAERRFSIKPYYKLFLVTGSVLVAVIIVYSILSLIEPTKDCGFDKGCFIEQANNCQKAIVREDLAGTIIKYSTKNCILTKEMEKIAASEPAQVKTLFQGKAMQCPYEENNFNPILVESLITSLNECSGDLQIVLNEIRIVQYEIGA